VTLKLSEFLDIDEILPHWNESIWFAGHPGSGREPSTPEFDPAISRREHNGTDFACQRLPIFAPAPANINLARWQNNGAGNAVTMAHGPTLIDVGERFRGEVRRVYTRKLHMDPDKKWQTKTFAVSEGQSVVAGQMLGFAGNSGSSAGIHVHDEAHVDEQYQPWYRHKSLDTELLYTGQTKGYWGGGDMESVKGLQRNLNALGYGPLVEDGNYGPLTEAEELKFMQDSTTGGGNLPVGEWVEVWGKQ